MSKHLRAKAGIVMFLAVFTFMSSIGAHGYAQDAAMPEALPKGGQEVGGLKAPGSARVKTQSTVVGQEFNPYSVVIPEEYGSIEEVFQGAPNAPLVIHIQDAHANYEAQLNIKKILAHLSKTYKVNLIQLEGASTKLNPAIFETASVKEANLKLADYLMREGRLSGAEAFAIEAEDPVELRGVEDRLLYMENLKTFRSVYSHQKEIREYFKAMRVLVKDLRTGLLNEELLDLTRNMEAYAQEKIELLDYLLYLNGLSEKNGIASLRSLKEITRFPNLVRIMRLHELEQKLNENELKKESEALKKAFFKKNVSPEVQDLLSKLDLRKKGVQPRLYFKRLSSLAEENGIDLLAYPQMRNMAEFLILQDEIEHHGLFREVRKLEKLLQKHLLKKPEERRLIRILQYLELLDQYFKLELNREKLVFIMKRYAKIKPSLIKKQLDELAEKHGVLASDYKGDTGKLDQYMGEVEYFYRLVLERDGLFVKNVLNTMKESESDRTVLITGGFHTDGLATLLRKENVSYLVAIPKVDVKQGSETYLKVMLEEDSAIGSVFAGTFALSQALRSVGAEFFPDSLYVLANNYLLAVTVGQTAAVQLSYAETNAAPDAREARAALDRFNQAQGLLHAEPVGEPRYDARSGTATYRFEIFRNDQGVIRSAIYETTVNGAGEFQTQRVSGADGEWKKADTRRVPGLAQLMDSANFTNRPAAAPTVTVIPLFQRTDLLTAAPVAVSPDTDVDDVRNVIPFPGTLVSRGVLPQQILSVLAQIQNNLFALKLLEERIRTSGAVTYDEMVAIQATSQPGTRPVSRQDIEQKFGTATQQANQLATLLGIPTDQSANEKPRARVLIVPSLESDTWEARASQLLSVVETLRQNAGAAAVVYGRDIETFALAVLGVDKKDLKADDVLKRITFVNVDSDEKALDFNVVRGVINRNAFNLYKRFGSAYTPQPFRTAAQLFEGGYVRVLLPEGAAGDDLSGRLAADTNLQRLIQLRSVLQRDGVARNPEFARAFASVQVKFLNILPDSEQTSEQALQDLGSMVRAEGRTWTFVGGVEKLVADLFRDFLAAREVAIRA